ncbi:MULTISPECIES: Smr/MutS family protein [unclassified Achromobacter]|uniref:Smr/MutS family protein n=1 Tax=unclassified Achromobacter TaxID=2626865 RepID=UPI000B51668D|nr:MULTISPECIES: Smr/MutS family protein [unclassified Achromobacter]OWT72860.1 DNA mismatch repair protein MutS [Achromobacter sp. HZ34]OWT74078.1 DNA mismatch repair protein MutS [Achromobacter sp. HZ28]
MRGSNKPGARPDPANAGGKRTKGSLADSADLKDLRDSLRESSRAQALRPSAAMVAAQAAKAAAKDDGLSGAGLPDDPKLFERAMRNVQKQAPARVAQVAPVTPPAEPKEPTLAQAMRRAHALGEQGARADGGVSDGADITRFLSENGTAFVRHDAAPDTARNLRRGAWRTGAELDLHGLRVEQARHALFSFLDECLEFGIRCVRVVHGKGHGSLDMEPVLKDKVRTWLVQKPEVMAFAESEERHGGAGALLVLLKLVDDVKR